MAGRRILKRISAIYLRVVAIFIQIHVSNRMHACECVGLKGCHRECECHSVRVNVCACGLLGL